MRLNFCKLPILFLAIFTFQNGQIQACYGQAVVEKLPPGQAGWRAQSHRYGTSGLSFSYPWNWQISEKPDKDTIAKITGTLPDGAPAEISLRVSDAQGVSADTLSKLFSEAYLSKLANYKLLSDKKVSFGEGWLIEGIDKQISFDIKDTTFRQRYIFFDGTKGAMIVTFSAPAANFENMEQISHQVLMSIKKERQAHSQISTRQPESWGFESLQSPLSPLTFSYPKSWQVQTRADKDSPLSIHGVDSLGKPGYIEVHSGIAPPTVGLDTLANSLEEKYFAGLKDYRRIKQEPINCGSMNNLQGIVHEMTFSEGSQTVKQMSLFFVQDGRLYSFTLGGPGWNDNDVRTLFYKIVATIKAIPS